MPIEIIPEIFAGLAPLYAARNGMAAYAQAVRQLAALLNHCAGKHTAVIPAMEVPFASVRNSASDLRLWSTRFKSAPNAQHVISHMRLLPCDDVTQTPQWYLKLDAAAQTTQQHNSFCAAGAGLTLGDIFDAEQEIDISASTEYAVHLYTKGKCRVQAWSLREKERNSLDPATDVVVALPPFVPHGDVLDAGLTDLIATADSLWQDGRSPYGSWNVNDPATPVVPTTTATNIWDASTSRTANTVGFMCPTQYRNSYMGTTVPVKVWAYGERTSVDGSLTVSFVAAGGSIDVTINGVLGMFTATGTLTAAAGGDKVDVQLKKDVAGTTGNLYAVGIYPLFA